MGGVPRASGVVTTQREVRCCARWPHSLVPGQPQGTGGKHPRSSRQTATTSTPSDRPAALRSSRSLAPARQKQVFRKGNRMKRNYHREALAIMEGRGFDPEKLIWWIAKCRPSVLCMGVQAIKGQTKVPV